MPGTLHDVVFVDGIRTPFGKAGQKGIYAQTRADDLIVKCIRELIRRHPELPPERVDEVAIAATTQTGDQGLTIGRTAALLAGLPKSVPGFAIDRMCAGAMTAVTTTASGIAFGAYDVVIAGGVEHMGHHPMGEGVDPNPRFVSEQIVDTSALVMGQTAENLHDKFPELTKDRTDAYAVGSQAKLQAAYEAGRIQRDLVPVAIRNAEQGWGLAVADEPPRPGTTLDDLAKLKTPFRPHGRITAGNAAGLNDGATACLLASAEAAAELGLPVKMRLVGYAFKGVEPEIMGYGPVPATEEVLRRTGLSIDDIGLFEINEAFAVQVLSFLDFYGIKDDDPRVNPDGGAIAIGHPLASSGVRLMTQLARHFEDHPEVRYGLTTMCIGIGMGGSVIWENPHHKDYGTTATGSLGMTLTDSELRAEAASALPDEVVTSALVRDVVLPGNAGTLALITLDNGLDHTKPSTFGPRGLFSLQTALDQVQARANAGEIVAVGITGKPFIFAVGADLGMVKAGGRRDQALLIGQLGHAQFRRLGDLPVPSFAYVNGAALGGGLEIALHCTYRTLSSGIPALALPECFLGLVPAWGGAYLLPNLIGPQKALEVIISNPLNQNKMLNGVKAFQLGIGDALFEPADFLEQSLVWTSAVLRGEIVISRPEIDRSEDDWEAAVAGAKAFADLKVSGAAPAPYRALELVSQARTADRDAAFAAEDEALADLSLSQELRAGLYAFDLVTKRAKRPAGAPDKNLARPVTTIGIVGAGLMASQFALLFVRRLKVPVIITDLDQARVDKGVGYVHGELDKLLAKGRISQDAANRLKSLVSGSTDKADFAAADVVIEAVFEEMSVKKQVFAEVEAVVSDTCLLLTNTSSLSVTEMAADLKHPERLVGFHFFNPVAILPLLEIVRGEQTDDASLATAFKVSREIKKSSVLVKDAPAFVVNRLLTRFLGEVTAAVDEGTDPVVADRALAPLGLPMTPFVLLQLVGPAIGLHVGETLHGYYPDRFGVSENLRRLVEAGKPGIWSWSAEGKPYLADDTKALLQVGDAPQTAEQVRERALNALAEEIGLMLDEGVVEQPQDIDLCMIMGAGWPFHLGGITPYLDREGISEKVIGRRFLPAGVATLPA